MSYSPLIHPPASERAISKKFFKMGPFAFLLSLASSKCLQDNTQFLSSIRSLPQRPGSGLHLWPRPLLQLHSPITLELPHGSRAFLPPSFCPVGLTSICPSGLNLVAFSSQASSLPPKARFFFESDNIPHKHSLMKAVTYGTFITGEGRNIKQWNHLDHRKKYLILIV